MDGCDSISTPMATTRIDADLQGTLTDQTKYRSMIGGLTYLTASRPSIAFTTFVCARTPYTETPQRDADHARCHDDCKSTSRGIQFLGDKLVSWSSKKQDCTAMSTAEAECNNYAVLPNIPCPRECRIVWQLLVDHALSYALTATADILKEITYTVDMFRVTLKLPVETPEQSFIPPATVEYIQPFLKIVGYQGFVDKVDAFYTKNLAQPWQTMFKYPRFTKLITANIMEKFESIPKRIEEDYHSIKNDTLLVSVYTTRDVTVRGMLIMDILLTDAIRDTQTYKDYEEEINRVGVPTIQLEPVESTQWTNRTSRATKTTNLVDVVQKKKGKRVAGETSSPRKSLKIQFKHQKRPTTTPPPPSDDRELEEQLLNEGVEKFFEGREEESDGTKFADLVFLSDDDFGNRVEPVSHKKNPKKIDDDDDENKDDRKDDDDIDDNDHIGHALIRNPRTGDIHTFQELLKEYVDVKDNLPRIVANVVKKERESSRAGVPTLISQEFVTHAPKIIKELFRIHMQNIVLNVHPTTSASTVTTTFDLQQQLYLNMVLNVHPTTSASTVTTTSDLQQKLYLKMKLDLQAQVDDPELWDVLRAKFEKTSASAGSCRDDAFRKRNHDDHQGDDDAPKGEKSTKRQKT
ncbi:hypothetical protein Tco_1062826, partial [Tanacetum coccineum]